MYMGFNSFEEKREVDVIMEDNYHALGLVTEKGRMDINLEPKDLAWLKMLRDGAQKIIDLYEKQED